MPKVAKSVVVAKPPSEVFEYLADFANTAQWDPGVAEARQSSSGPVGLGTTFDLVAIFRGRRIPVTYEVTVFEPNTRVVLVGKNKRFTGTDDVTFAPEGGGTRIGWNADFQMEGLGKLVQPFLGGVFEQLSVEAMEGLQATLGRLDS
jgi:carbon monoxide dehydrogenase subunit G